MATDPTKPVTPRLIKEIHAAALTLQESAEHLRKLTRLVSPDASNCQFIVKQAYLTIRGLAKQFEIEL